MFQPIPSSPEDQDYSNSKYYDPEEERREVKLMMLIDNLKDDALRFMNDNQT